MIKKEFCNIEDKQFQVTTFEPEENLKKSYYAIIPANIRYDKNICANAKLLYGEITALCNEKGYCWASNNYFSKLYNVSKTSISLWISQLKKFKYINTKMIYKEGTKQILNRYLTIINDPIQKKLNTPIKENLKENITLINNTININVSFKELKDKYNSWLLEKGYKQEQINEAIYTIPNGKKGNKQTKCMKELFEKFISIEKFDTFLLKADKYNWLRDKTPLPSLLLACYDKIIMDKNEIIEEKQLKYEEEQNKPMEL